MSAQSALTRRLLGDGTEPSGDELGEGGMEIISTAEGDRTGAVTYIPLGAQVDPGWTAYVPDSGDVYRPELDEQTPESER